jgi:hypothetical protein
MAIQSTTPSILGNSPTNPLRRNSQLTNLLAPRRTSTAKVLCSGCGHDNHLVATCRFKSTEVFNSYPYAYKGSKAHKLLLAKYPDATVIPFTELSKDNPRSSASGSSSSKYRPKPTCESQTISNILSTMYSDTSDNNYIDVSVSATLQASIRTRNNVKALLDTGSLAVDFVAFRTLQALNLEPYILTNGYGHVRSPYVRSVFIQRRLIHSYRLATLFV